MRATSWVSEFQASAHDIRSIHSQKLERMLIRLEQSPRVAFFPQLARSAGCEHASDH
jgi:hypothetical protein